jgi:hypothetical protein
LMSAETVPEKPGLRRAAMTGSGTEPGLAVLWAEATANMQPERVSERRTPQAR